MFNALIRTHHITSRKKVAKLKQAADACDVYALLRSGGCPGIMYVEGEERGVRQWVDSVHVSALPLSPSNKLIFPTIHYMCQIYHNKKRPHVLKSATMQNLRYKDYQLASRPAVLIPGTPRSLKGQYTRGLDETDTVKDFAAQMRDRGVHGWWRVAMGYASSPDTN